MTFAVTLYYKLTCSSFYGFNVCFNQLICKINIRLPDNFYGLLRIKNTTIIGLNFYILIASEITEHDYFM